MPERIPVILNPAARSTQAAAREKAIRALTPAPELILTEGPGQATELAEKLAREGHPLIVAAGGDGTMNEVLQGLCRVNAARPAGEKHTALGVLPVGTMNVFSLELGLPSADLPACWAQISQGRFRELDLWMANDQYFVQLAGVGFDAEIIQETSWESKKRFGPLSYVMSAMQVLTRQPPVLSVHIEGRPSLHGSVVLVGAGRHYGGPVPVFRQASNQDGLLDVLVFRGLGGWEFAQMLRAILVDGYEPAEDIDYLQLREFTVTSTPAAPLEVDGELASIGTPVVFQAAPFKVQVAV
ncbi:diacylglycerol/lipid kinase family protein [Prosthecobacter dejongeii]|uniref:YegS/Rv2252/BmrU family lipid kinase n=1 Tax=Prosthecobacter dejongeii TaxID=48465 RepID=A0A7W8DQX9_9BACT|nr:diacylglycerol kinase family protein [Prosthecobacter dejongeii]MBB5038690.1 YegS/Rv2252/BmrU family lipid kinase [Prosthecobacter dejongeii]